MVTSTSEVYGTAQYVPIDEKHPYQGQSPYCLQDIQRPFDVGEMCIRDRHKGAHAHLARVIGIQLILGLDDLGRDAPEAELVPLVKNRPAHGILFFAVFAAAISMLGRRQMCIRDRRKRVRAACPSRPPRSGRRRAARPR